MKKSLLFLPLLLSLFACTDETKSSLNLSIPDNASAEVKQLLQTNWPKVKQFCPGLDKYADALQFDKIEDNFSFAPSDAQRVSIEYIIKTDQHKTPGYMLAGNRCFFEISRDGKTLMIDKGACKSLCKDQDLRGTEGPLKSNLQ